MTDPPKLVNSTTHGKLLTVGDGDDLIYVLHVWGKACDLQTSIVHALTLQALPMRWDLLMDLC